MPALAVPVAQCLKGAGFEVSASLLEGLLGGRKRPSMNDLLKTALAGCLSDLFNPLDRLGDVARMAEKAAGSVPKRFIVDPKGHKPSTPADPRAQIPRAHVPGVTNSDGTPWLPVN